MHKSKPKSTTSKRPTRISDPDEDMLNLLDSDKNFKKCMDKWIADEANHEQIRLLQDCGHETKEFTTTRESFNELIKGLELDKRTPKTKEFDDAFMNLQEDDCSNGFDIKSELEDLRSFPKKIMSGKKLATEMHLNMKKKEMKDKTKESYLPSSFKGLSEEDFKLTFKKYSQASKRDLIK